MRTRKLRWVVAAGLVTLAGLGAFVLWQRPSPVTRANFYRVRGAMNARQVEAILGSPGDYTTGPVCLRIGVDTGSEERNSFDDTPYTPDTLLQRWWTDTDCISVHYNLAGTVSEARYNTVTPFERDPLSRLRWLWDRLWHRARLAAKWQPALGSRIATHTHK